jgi:hypothetical protein
MSLRMLVVPSHNSPQMIVLGGDGPKLAPLNLIDDERSALEAWSRRRKPTQALALRSRIILAPGPGRLEQRGSG